LTIKKQSSFLQKVEIIEKRFYNNQPRKDKKSKEIKNSLIGLPFSRQGTHCLNGTARIKNENNCLNTNIYSYLETSGGQVSDPYLNVAHFFNTRVV
jgi:hypothetical protein